MKSETRPAIITVVTLVFASIQSGIILTVPTKGIISFAKAIPQSTTESLLGAAQFTVAPVSLQGYYWGGVNPEQDGGHYETIVRATGDGAMTIYTMLPTAPPDLA